VKRETTQATFASQPSREATVPTTHSGLRVPPTAAVEPEVAGGAEDEVPPIWNPDDVILDLYEVKEVHGGGGMGLVYRVHHRGWNMDLAVKSPRPEYFTTENQKQNFESECETWIDLGLHPHIVSCYYVRRLGGIPRIFAEYVEGGSLKEWIGDRRLYEGGPEEALKRILDIAIQFAWGLHYAHEKGLIHQDVKPANVMMMPEGLAKVADFGLAKARGAAGELAAAGLQQSILVSFGGMTPAYCSPEQANGQPLSRKTDIWSWAVSLLEMFTGEVTWMAGQIAGEALSYYGDVGPEDSSIPRMPAGLVDLLKRCLRNNPEDRPTNFEEIATELRRLHQEVTGQEYPREEPKAADLLADGLNNKALTMLDLGKNEETLRLFEEAITAEPHHPEATFNRGMMRWRSAAITDLALVQELEEVRTSHRERWIDEYLLGLVHIERGDAESAVAVLEDAVRQVPGDDQIESALVRARAGLAQWPRCVRRLRGFWGAVASVCFSPDGRLALSGHKGGTIQLWDVARERCLWTSPPQSVLTGCELQPPERQEWHTKCVTSIHFSPDGRCALSGSEDQTLRLWDVETGRCIRTFVGHTETVRSVSFSPDGRRTLSGSWDKTVRLWDVGTGRCVRAFEGHTEAVGSVCFSPDGQFVLSGSWDKTARLWDVGTGRCVRMFEGHTGAVGSVCFSPDGQRVLSGSGDKTLRAWDAGTGRCVRMLEGHTGGVLSFSRDGLWALSGSGRGTTLQLWDIRAGRCVRTIGGHTGGVMAVSFSPDGVWAAVGSGSSELAKLHVWAVTSDSRRESFAIARPVGVSQAVAAQLQADAHLAQAEHLLEAHRFPAALEQLRTARGIRGYQRTPRLLAVWRAVAPCARRPRLLGAWHKRAFVGHTDLIYSVGFSPDGRWAISGSLDKTLRLWDVRTGRCVRGFEGHTAGVCSVSFSPDGRWAISGSLDMMLRLWDVQTGHCVQTFDGHTEGVYSVCFSPDARWAISGSGDHTLRLWDILSGRCVRTFEGHPFDGHTSKVTSVCFSPDGRWILSGGVGAQLLLWDVETGHFIRDFEGHTVEVFSVCFTPDGRHALSGSTAPTLCQWDIESGRCIRAFDKPTEIAWSVCITPDGRWALSGREETLCMWDVGTGHCLRTFQGHTARITSVCCSFDGQLALSGSMDKTLRLWEFDWDLEVPEPSDWDDGARPYLENFLCLHTPYAATLPDGGKASEAQICEALTRRGKPAWNEEDFKLLLRTLSWAGYGWLRPEGVHKKLEGLSESWDGPHQLPCP
jgi:WD40 repeat protein/serine/threonine protein kinase